MSSSRPTEDSSCRRRVDSSRQTTPKDRILSHASKGHNSSAREHRCNRKIAVSLGVTLSAMCIVWAALTQRNVLAALTRRNGVATAGRDSRSRDLLTFRDSTYDIGKTLILVLSAPSNRKRRDAIRETWGDGYSNIRFVVGHNNDPTLAGESNAYRDMMLLDIVDTYDTLPQKLHAALLKVSYQSESQWIVKVDDDMFLHLDKFPSLLRAFNPQIPMIMGFILQDEPVRNYGKWEERTFQGPIYPTFPQGSCGYVMSRAVVEYIASAEPLEFYHGEDTSLGIWLSSWRTENDASVVQWIHAPTLFWNDGDCEKHPNAAIIGHKISPDHMKRCFSSMVTADALHSTRDAEDIIQLSGRETGKLPLRNDKKDSLEYKQAIGRYEQKQYADEREREREQKRLQREQRRQGLLRTGKT